MKTSLSMHSMPDIRSSTCTLQIKANHLWLIETAMKDLTKRMEEVKEAIEKYVSSCGLYVKSWTVSSITDKMCLLNDNHDIKEVC